MEFNNNKPFFQPKTTSTPLGYLHQQNQSNQQAPSSQTNGLMPPQVISIDLSRKSKQSQSASQDPQSAKLSQTGSDQDSASWSQKSNPRVMQYSLPQSNQVTGSKSPQSIIFFNQNGDAGFGALQSQPTPTSTINIVNYKHKNYPATSITAQHNPYQESVVNGSQSQISLSIKSQPQLRDVSGMNALREDEDDQVLENPSYAREDDEEDEEDADNNIDEMMSSSSASMIAQSQTNRFPQHAIHSDRGNHQQFINRLDNSQQLQQQPMNSKLINSSSITRKLPQNIKQINSSQVNQSSFQLQTQMLSPTSLSSLKQLRPPMGSSEMFNAFQGTQHQRENQTMVNISKSQWKNQPGAGFDSHSLQADKTPNSMNKKEFSSRYSGMNSQSQYQQIVPKRLMEQANFNDQKWEKEVKSSARGIHKPQRHNSDSEEEQHGRNQGQDEDFYSMTEQDADVHQDAFDEDPTRQLEEEAKQQHNISQSEQDQDFQEDDQEPQEEEDEENYDDEDFKAFEQNNLRNGLSIDKYGDSYLEQQEDENDPNDDGDVRDSQKSISPDEKSQPIQIQEPNQIGYFSNSQEDSNYLQKHSSQNSEHSNNFQPRSSGRTDLTSSAADGTRASDNQPFFNIQSYSGGLIEKNDRFVVVKPGQGNQKEITQSSVFTQQHMIERNLQSHNNKVYRETVEDINSSEGEEETKKHSKIKSYNKQRRSVPEYLKELDQSEQEQYQILSHSPIEEERYGKTQVMDHTSMIEESRIDYSQLKSMTNQILSPTTSATATAFNQAVISTTQFKQSKPQNINKHSHKQFFDDSSRNQQQKHHLQSRTSDMSATSTNEKFNRMQKQQRKDHIDDIPLPIEQTQQIKGIYNYHPQESSQRDTHESPQFEDRNNYDDNFPQFQHLHQQTSSSNNILDFGTQEIVEPMKMADRRQSDSAVLERNSVLNSQRNGQRPSQLQNQVRKNLVQEQQKPSQTYEYEEKKNLVAAQQDDQANRLPKGKTKPKQVSEKEQLKLQQELQMLQEQLKQMQKIKASKQAKSNIPVSQKVPTQEKHQVMKSQDIGKSYRDKEEEKNLQSSKSKKRLQQQQSLKVNERDQNDRNVLLSYQSEEYDNEHIQQDQTHAKEFKRHQEKDLQNLYTVQQSVKSKDGRGKNLFKAPSQQQTVVQSSRRENLLRQRLSPHREGEMSRDLSKGYKSSKHHNRDEKNTGARRGQKGDISSSVSPGPRSQYQNQKTNRTYISKQNPTFKENQNTIKRPQNQTKRRGNGLKDDSYDAYEQKKMNRRKNNREDRSSDYSDQEQVHRPYDEEGRSIYSEESQEENNENSYEQQEDLSDYSRSDSNAEEISGQSYDDEYDEERSYDSQEQYSHSSGNQRKHKHRRVKNKRRQRQHSNNQSEEESEDDQYYDEDTKVITKTAKYGNKKLKININMHEKKQNKKQSKRQKEEEMLMLQQKQILQQQQLVLQMAQYPHQQMLLQQQQLAMQQQLLLQPQLAMQAQMMNPQINMAAQQTRLLDITSPTIHQNINGQNTSFVPSSNNVSMLGGQVKRFQRDGSSSHFTNGRRDTSNGERFTGSFATSNNQSSQPPGSLKRANEMLSKHFSPRREDLFTNNQNQSNRQQYPTQIPRNNQREEEFNTMYSPRDEGMSGGGSKSFIGAKGHQDSFYDEQMRYQNQQQQSTSYLHQIKNRMRQRDELEDFNEEISQAKNISSRNKQQMLQTNSSPVKYQNDLYPGNRGIDQDRQRDQIHARFGSRDRQTDLRQQNDLQQYGNPQRDLPRKAFEYQDKRSQDGATYRQNRVFSQQDFDEDEDEHRRYFNKDEDYCQQNIPSSKNFQNFAQEERYEGVSRRQSEAFNKPKTFRQQQYADQYGNQEEDDSLIYSKFDYNQSKLSQQLPERNNQRQRENHIYDNRQFGSRERDFSQEQNEGIDFYRKKNLRGISNNSREEQLDYQDYEQPVLKKKPTGNFAQLTKMTNTTHQRSSLGREKMIIRKRDLEVQMRGAKLSMRECKSQIQGRPIKFLLELI